MCLPFVVVAAVSIWYIVWGIPLTIRCYKFLSAKFTAYRSRQAGLPEDVEKDDEAEGVSLAAAHVLVIAP